MDLAALLQQYGYWLLFVGTFLEGETIMLLGGMVAHLGHLSIGQVIVFGFLGSLFGDQLYFVLGRRHGNALLVRFPTWRPLARQVFAKLEQHQTLFIIGFRFLYGLRTVSPFAIGMTNVSRIRYTFLNAIGAAIWAIALGTAGYVFGKAAERVVGDLKRYEMALLFGTAGLAFIVWVIYLFGRQRHKPPTI